MLASIKGQKKELAKQKFCILGCWSFRVEFAFYTKIFS